MVEGKTTEVDTPTIPLGATPSRLINDLLHHPPIFTPDAFLPQPSQFFLAWDSTKYAGLHTQWLGFGQSQNFSKIE